MILAPSARFLTEFPRNGRRVEQICNHRADNMLGGMILHMMPSSFPVDDDFNLVFSAFDLDGNGTVDHDEFRGYSKKYGLEKVPPIGGGGSGVDGQFGVRSRREPFLLGVPPTGTGPRA